MDRSKWCCLGDGPLDAKLVFIGEAPGVWEKKFGKPFYERAHAGGKLKDVMQVVGLARSQVYITNVLKEHPPNDDIKHWFSVDKGRIYASQDYREYVEVLKEELLQFKGIANVFMPLGNSALYALTEQVKITKRRGSILEGKFWPGMKVIPSIHPSAIADDRSNRGEYMYFHYLRMDMKRAIEESKFPEIILPSRNLQINPSYFDVMKYLTECLVLESVGVDIEVSSTSEEITCISFAKTPLDVMSINFTKHGADTFTPSEEADIWLLIERILGNPNIAKRGQNFIFDAAFMYRKLGIKSVNVDDTMICMKTTFPDFPMGLDFITTMYTKEPYYKDEGKKWGKIGNEDEFYKYNAKDSAVCTEAFPKVFADCKRQGNERTYNRQKALIPILTFMQEYGMRVDTEGMKQESQKAGEELEILTMKLQDMVGYSINPNSPDQLMKYFYEKLGIKPFLKDGKPTTNLNALIRMARAGIVEADIIRKIRKLAKLKGTYYDMNLSDDGRLRSAMSPTDVTGRLSSSSDIFDRGGNMQNLPETIRRYILADVDHIMYILDLSQAENRIVAYIGPEPLMIQAFESGTDVHRQTAALCFGMPFNEVSDEEGSSSIGNGEHSQRYWGKKANHEFNYDRGYKTFAIEFEISEKEGKFIHDRYHQVYPGVHQYHSWVKAQLGKNRMLENPYGRVRLFLERWGDGLFKQAYAHIPQSTVADKINEEGLIYIYNNQQWYSKTMLLNQIHDAVVFQIPIDAGWLYHAECLLRIVESLETPITWRGTTFTIPVDTSMGFCLKKDEGKKVKIHGQDAQGLAKQLHGLYEQLRITTELSSVVGSISNSSVPST